MSEKPFAPAWGDTTAITNAIAATAAVDLPESCQQIVVYNSSDTARVHIIVTPYSGIAPTGDAPTTSTGLPVPPATQIRISVGPGKKVLRTIATAADGTTFVTPGNGD